MNGRNSNQQSGARDENSRTSPLVWFLLEFLVLRTCALFGAFWVLDQINFLLASAVATLGITAIVLWTFGEIHLRLGQMAPASRSEGLT